MPATKKTKKDSGTAAEEKKPASKKESGSAMPLYFGILLLIVGLVIGFGIHALVFPPQVIIQREPANTNSVSWVFLSSSECKMCASQSSLELLLASRQVVSNVENLDEASPQGAQLVQQYGIGSFPTAIVSADLLQQTDPSLLTLLKSKFPSALQNGVLVLPEKDLMQETKVYSAYMLRSLPEGVSLSVPTGKTVLWEFGDDLERATFDALPTVSAIVNDFNQQLEFDFKHMGLYPNSEATAVIDECSKKIGLFPAYHKFSIERYNTRNRPIWDWIEGRNLALELGIMATSPDVNIFKECVQSQETLPIVQTSTGLDANLSKAYGIQRVPTFVLNGRFVIIGYQELQKDLCLQFPELTACKEQ
jgi:hypothetical protein